jgi:flagellar biosynthetic protein FliR
MTGLLAGLGELAGIGADLLWAGLVVFLRIGTALSLTPAFGEQVVPVRVRLAVALEPICGN